MTNDIGYAAGMIWEYLVKNKEADAIKMKLNLKLSNTMLYLAVGWLAREGKIEIKRYSNNLVIKLK